MSYRTTLFILLSGVFLVTAPAVVLYSQGHRFDFKTLSLVQTGGLFVEASPRGALLFLNEKKRSSTSPLFGTKFIQNLLPGQYTVRIKKDGFSEWVKRIDIKEKQTTELRAILLVPLNPSSEKVLGNIDSFFVQKDKQILTALARNGGAPDATFLHIALEDPATRKTYTFRGEAAAFLKKEVHIRDASSDGKILLETKNPSEEQGAYVIVNFGNLSTATISVPDIVVRKEERVRSATFHPKDSRYILLRSDEAFYVWDAKQEQTILEAPDISAFATTEAEIYYVNGASGTMFSSPIEELLPSQDKTPGLARKTAYPMPEDLRTGQNFEAFTNGGLFLFAGDTLFFWQPEKKTWDTVLSGIYGVYKPKHQRRLLAWNTNTIWHLGPKKDGALNESTLRMAARYHAPVGDVFWFDKNSSYIVFGVGNQIEIKELSFDNQENTVRLPFRVDDFFFHQKTGTLYYIQDGTLYKSMLYAS